MPPALRHPALLWAAALGLGALLLYFGSQNVYWSDYGNESIPAVEALMKGDWHEFFARVPSYGTSLVLRIPLIVGVDALGGGEDLIYRAGAAPFLLALAALAVYLTRRAAASGATRLAIVLTLALSAGAPLLGQALNYGHPEEVLAAAGAVGAVLLALRDRPLLAGVALGLAIAGKQWAVIAVVPALLAADRGHVRLLLAAGVTLLIPLLPLLLFKTNLVSSQPVNTFGVQFHGQQLWWPLGVEAPAGVDAPGPLVAPSWLQQIVRPLILAVGAALALTWWGTGGRRRRREDVLLVLALALLARCALDPWNVHYYHGAFLLALLAWEVVTARGVPLLTLIATAGVWVSFIHYTPLYGYTPFLLYLAWAAPLAGYLAWTLFGGPANLRRPMVPAGTPAPSGA